MPLSTYRLQLGPDLDFAAAAGLVDYLAALGVTHLYLSPVLAAREGSTHGYDVADPRAVSPALGGEQGLRELASTARRRGLGLVVDIVPNHVGTGGRTPLWDRLLAEGPADWAAGYFDVDWTPALPGAAGKVVLPVLGDQYGRVLTAGELALEERGGQVRLRYHEHDLPISRESAEAVARSGGVSALGGRPGDPGSWHRLHALLEAQHYRLVHWRFGEALVNYRRFFSINDLAAVRVEDGRVFDHTHGKILALVADGVVDGLRVDHPDGLADPRRYFERLAEATGGIWVVAEKILLSHGAGRDAHDEALPDWPVAGTTGYEFANDVLALFVDPDAEATLDRLDAAFGGSPETYADQAAAAKAEALEGELAADLHRLTRAFWALAQEHPEVRDVDDRACRAALAGLLVGMDVYRTYVDPLTADARPDDIARIEVAARWAEDARGREPPFLRAFLVDVLSGRAGDGPAHREVLTRFQQLSGALTAKGVEDTALYRYRRLLAVNEVGGDPSSLGSDAATFHERNARRARRHPAGMLTTATHDTKRGEDSRLRIAALSELADEWADACALLRRQAAAFVSPTPAGPAPDPPTEYLVYQTLVGVWPLRGDPDAETARRVREYAIKACREAKQRTSWREPDPTFEDAVSRFVDAVLGSEGTVTALAGIAGRAAEVAMVAGLAQTLLRVASPGVPDTYRGCELWDDSLVDPDNRRPVDYPARARMLAELDGEDPGGLLGARRDGRVKLWVLSRALHARGTHADSLGPGGGYQPVDVEGRWARHVVAFARTPAGGSHGCVVVVPRLPGRVMRATGSDVLAPPIGDLWADTAVSLPVAGEWTDALTGRGHSGDRLRVEELFATLPVSLLVRPERAGP